MVKQFSLFLYLRTVVHGPRLPSFFANKALLEDNYTHLFCLLPRAVFLLQQQSRAVVMQLIVHHAESIYLSFYGKVSHLLF